MGRQAKLKRERRRRRERADQLKLERAVEGERRGCLICSRSDGGFTTAEHPFAESVGNTSIVLPNGVVCDRCNNGILSDLDQALAEFFPLKLQRTLLGIPTKSGKVPVTRFSTGLMRNEGDANIFIESSGPESVIRKTSLGGNLVKLDFSMSGGRRITPRYCSTLSRSILKSTLECAWLDHGDAMLDPKWDHVRRAILGEDRRGYLCVMRKGEPESRTLELTYQPMTRTTDGAEFLFVAAHLYGVTVFTDSLNERPGNDIPDEVALTVTF